MSRIRRIGASGRTGRSFGPARTSRPTARSTAGTFRPSSRRRSRPDRGEGRRPSGAGGFTLVETLVALFVIVVGMLPLLGLLLNSRHLDLQARAQAAAYNVGRNELETLRAQSYVNRTAVSGATFPIPSSITSEFPTQNLSGSYSIINRTDLGDSTHLIQQIVVSVTWQNAAANGPTSSVRLDTLVAQGAAQ
jgi:type II secretory pathway pseudopilin PulG